MVFLSVAICYCGEEREFGNLMCFLSEVIDPEKTEILVLVDTTKVDPDFGNLRTEYPFAKFFGRDFDGHFANHKNFLSEQCQGEFIFNVDADEIPSEVLLKNLENYEGPHDLLAVPRINVCPGYTQAFLDRWGFNLNDAGWINWPDWQGRFYKKGLQWDGNVHEKLTGYTSVAHLDADPRVSLIHVKDVKRQNKQNESYARLTELNS